MSNEFKDAVGNVSENLREININEPTIILKVYGDTGPTMILKGQGGIFKDEDEQLNAINVLIERSIGMRVQILGMGKGAAHMVKTLSEAKTISDDICQKWRNN